MTAMVTYAGLDVHARSTYAAAIDVETGELVRASMPSRRAQRHSSECSRQKANWIFTLQARRRVCATSGSLVAQTRLAGQRSDVWIAVDELPHQILGYEPGCHSRPCFLTLPSASRPGSTR